MYFTFPDDIKFRVSFIEVYRLFENTKDSIDMVYDRYCLCGLYCFFYFNQKRLL